jgi:hypothetical protein
MGNVEHSAIRQHGGIRCRLCDCAPNGAGSRARRGVDRSSNGVGSFRRVRLLIFVVESPAMKNFFKSLGVASLGGAVSYVTFLSQTTHSPMASAIATAAVAVIAHWLPSPAQSSEK